MKAWIGACLLGLVLVSPAISAPPSRDGPGPGRGQQEQRGRPDGRGSYGRNAPEDQRMQREQPRRDGALTDEERRGLHRDLDKANRELYRRR